MAQFSHLHVHTQYSVLDGQSRIEDLISQASKYGQPALAVTDHGNMYGIKELVDKAAAFNKKHPEAPVKPIIGSEMYVAHESRFERKGREDQSSYHLILLAKNMTGYHNLVKLSSLSFIEGFYYKPRIDHELLEKYHEGLICCSACLGGEVPQAIMSGDMDRARRIVQWYRNLFGEDYYLEVQRHETHIPGAAQDTFEKQQRVNEVIFSLAQEYGIKVVATNDVHFTFEDDGPAHDRLICISTNSDFDSPKRLHYTQQEWLKSTDAMADIFRDHPETIENTNEIVAKVEDIVLDHGHILPIFPLPEPFTDSNDYLQHLTYEGAKLRYGDPIPAEAKERIDFELATIKGMGFPDYFLIVQDFIKAGRKMGVWVGPGRGSAAGSVVAYCLTITNLDPIKYNLLFERFLNPDRISMPDIDIDFDNEGRPRMFKYVEDKYGKDHISHVVTFGTMGCKSVLRDVGRIQKIPLQDTDRMAKAVPNEKFKIKKDNGEEKEVDPTVKLCVANVDAFKEASTSSDPLVRDWIRYSEKLEGTVRNTGVHACATIIGREDLTNFIPLCTAKDKETGEDMLVSQYEGTLIESVGMLKMDFLGLKTLSILRDCVELVKKTRGLDIDIDNIPMDDKATFELFSKGDTIGVFQYESEGMQSNLRELQPSRFEDLIAMNALYRPGPMAYIPDFIARKHGKQKIEYDLPGMDEYLADTYGITVYQEQVMLLSQKLAGFTKGQADTLRKAMGKKKIDVLEKMKGTFFEGGQSNGHPQEKLQKIWDDWTAFASYAFNKSHSTCYAWVGYQTGYMKANYPAEYMAAVLSNSQSMEDIVKFMDDCRHLGVQVLGPDVNESGLKFTVNRDGNIRFGMSGIKGVGAAVVEAIVREREEKGLFKDIFDFVERVDSDRIKRNVIEALAFAGAFDSLMGGDISKRATFLADAGGGDVFADSLARYGGLFQKSALLNENSLFGACDVQVQTQRPKMPEVPEADKVMLLQREKELVGMYLSDHPLKKYGFEIKHFSTMDIASLKIRLDDVLNHQEDFGKDVSIAALVTKVEVRDKKSGDGKWCKVYIEDFDSNMSFSVFSSDYDRYIGLLQQPNATLMLTFTIKPRYKFLSGNEKKDSSRKVERELTGGDLSLKALAVLDNVRTNGVKEVSIDLPVELLTEAFRKDLKDVLKKNKGKAMMKMNLIDKAKGFSVEMFSRKYQVACTDEMVEFLERHGLNYRIN
ncbi:MAG: DNA polymerase III subunit alpha [Bacteroidales bacterium]|nr:DNA polymerase III subunit alpha [Bacteroidales bacterium]